MLPRPDETVDDLGIGRLVEQRGEGDGDNGDRGDVDIEDLIVRLARAGEITFGQTTDDAGVVDQDCPGVICDDRESVAEASHRPACRTRPRRA